MRYFFIILCMILISASILTFLSRPNAESDVPVLYWVTDPNPARKVQVELFEKWLVKNGFCKPGEPTKPCMVLKIDAANSDSTKKIIQGVSGVGGDIMDVFSSNGDQILFYQIGLLTNVTEPAKSTTNMMRAPIHFDSSKTFSSISDDIMVYNDTGKLCQVAFPCNITTYQYWVNKGSFESVGMAAPDKLMNIDEFERIGKEFVKRANKDKKNQDTFFANTISTSAFVRSFGISYFNETLTECRLNDRRYINALEYIYKWTYEDRIIPSLADIQSASALAGYGGKGMNMFCEGKFGLYLSGRHALIRFREIQQSRKERGAELLKLGVIPLVYAKFPNTPITVRAAAVYAGGNHKKMATLFLAYLASREYNECIVADGDALPPNPEYIKMKEFIEPGQYTEEKGCHEPFAKAAVHTAIAMDYSQFIPPARMSMVINFYRDKFMNKQITSARAASETQETINEEILRNVSERIYLQEEYKRRCDLQKKIDQRIAVWDEIEELTRQGKAVPEELRSQAKKIPLEWLYNPFYRKYYQHKGWTE